MDGVELQFSSKRFGQGKGSNMGGRTPGNGQDTVATPTQGRQAPGLEHSENWREALWGAEGTQATAGVGCNPATAR